MKFSKALIKEVEGGRLKVEGGIELQPSAFSLQSST